MADLKMNEFTTVSSVSKVVGVDDNGNNRLISPNDLIQVGSKNGTIGDLNNALKAGAYTAITATENKPIEDYGLVEVIVNSIYIIQTFYGLNQSRIFYRRSIDNGSSFNEWVAIK